MQSTDIELLVVGAGRSGTSLLAGVLDYHSSLEIAFEQFTWEYLFGSAVPERDGDLFGRRVTKFIAACKEEARRVPGIKWGNKITTEQIGFLEEHNVVNKGAEIDVLEKFFNCYLKGTKIVYILRDGRACIQSKVSRTDQPLELACARWRYAVEVYRFLKQRHYNNICLKFEDLVADPAHELTRVCDFLEIPFEEEMIEGVQNPKIPTEYRRPVFDASKTRPVEIPRSFFTEIHDDLRFCEYL